VSATFLDGRCAVVTGGGRGIGAAAARALAEAGARVLVAARSTDQIERVAKDLRQSGHEVSAVACDVTDETAVERLARAAAERFSAVDVLVHSAGMASSAPLHRMTLAEWEEIFRVNVTGTFLCTRAFLPGMVDRKWGRVIHVASVAGLAGGKYISAYSASKHAVIGFTRSVAAEVAPSGVTVNAVCPGYVDTPMTREGVARIAARTGRTEAEALGAILATNPQGRLIEPDEVARTVTWLCEEEARGVNGRAIVIDGGGLAEER
jgi:NAD(P)-dependent dehydrogenase (short-subunit alcohol dehydrogenase family)